MAEEKTAQNEETTSTYEKPSVIERFKRTAKRGFNAVKAHVPSVAGGVAGGAAVLIGGTLLANHLAKKAGVDIPIDVEAVTDTVGDVVEDVASVVTE